MKQISTFDIFKPAFVLMGIIAVIGLVCYLYALTPQAIQADKDHQTQLQQMSCQDLFNKLHENIPHGYTVGGADVIMEDYMNALHSKECIK